MKFRCAFRVKIVNTLGSKGLETNEPISANMREGSGFSVKLYIFFHLAEISQPKILDE